MNANHNHQLPQEIKNLQIVLSAFKARKPLVNDFDTKISRLKTIMLEKKSQLKEMPNSK